MIISKRSNLKKFLRKFRNLISNWSHNIERKFSKEAYIKEVTVVMTDAINGKYRGE